MHPKPKAAQTMTLAPSKGSSCQVTHMFLFRKTQSSTSKAHNMQSNNRAELLFLALCLLLLLPCRSVLFGFNLED